MKRILHFVTSMDYGGVETLLMSIYRNIDREKIQFDFLCHNSCDNFFSKEIEELGGKMYAIPYASKVGYLGYLKGLYEFFKDHPEYKIIHSHINCENGNALSMAKKAGIPVRIAHSHVGNAKEDNWKIDIYKRLIRLKIPFCVTHCFACSKAAAKYLFKTPKNRNKCKIINNAINTNRFMFSKSARDKIRKEYGLEGKFVIGNIGRFSYEKNQIFSIKLFEEYSKCNPNAVLIFLGAGEDMKKHKEYVKAKGLEDKVLFLGSHNNVPDFLSAMDVFLFPSLFEGLGIVAIEAQASGLPVLASDMIPRETDLTDLINYYPLDTFISWLEALKNFENKDYVNREQYAKKVKDMDYDIESTAKYLENFYLSL